MAPYLDEEELASMRRADGERSRSPSVTIIQNEDGDQSTRGAPRQSMTPDTESTTGSIATIRSRKRKRSEGAGREWEASFELIREDGDLWRWCRHTNANGVRCSKKYRFKHGTTGLRRHMQVHQKEDEQIANQRFMTGYILDNYTSRPMCHSRLRRALLTFIIMHDHPLNIVHQPYFIAFLKATDTPYRLPSRRTVARDIEHLYLKAKAAVKKRMRAAAKVSILMDGWTADIQTIGYLGILATFIETSQKGEDGFIKPGQWHRREIVLSMREVQTDVKHSGDVLAQDLINVMDDYDIVNRFTALVTDNASNMSRTAKMLRQDLIERGVIPLDRWHIRCLSHVLNLVTEGFLAGLNSNGNTADMKRRSWDSTEERSALRTTSGVNIDRDIMRKARDESDEENKPNDSRRVLDEMLQWEDELELSDFMDMSDTGSVRAPERYQKSKGKRKRVRRATQATSDDDNPPTFTASGHGVRFELRPPRGSLGHAIRALRFVGLYIHSSPKRLAMFKNANSTSPLPVREVVTRWTSTYDMLSRAVSIREQLLAYVQHIDKTFSDATPVARDFDIAEDALKILWPFYRVVDLAQKSEKDGDGSLSSAVIALDTIYDHVDDLAEGGKKLKIDLHTLGFYDDVMVGVKIARVILRKYYSRTDSELHSAATFVNPHMRATWWKSKFGDESMWIASCLRQARQVFDKYAQRHRADSVARHDTPAEKEVTRIVDLARAIMDDKPRDEFELYKDGALADENTSALDWWSQNCSAFPILARMAADLLGISASAAPVEREFSHTRKLIHYQRSRLREYRVGMMTCLRSWIREFGEDWVMGCLDKMTDDEVEAEDDTPFLYMPDESNRGAPRDYEDVYG